MEFKHLVEAAEKWCSGNPFDLIFAEEDDERRLDFYAEPGVSFYVLCPGGTDSFHVWSESEDCLPFLQLAQDYISSCGKKTLLEVLEKVFTSFRPVRNRSGDVPRVAFHFWFLYPTHCISHGSVCCVFCSPEKFCSLSKSSQHILLEIRHFTVGLFITRGFCAFVQFSCLSGIREMIFISPNVNLKQFFGK
uniref:Maturin n=1 Tax=Astatotilapia calliptera TaxID=8154 RepID=A0AAX7UM53_ASTCA